MPIHGGGVETVIGRGNGKAWKAKELNGIVSVTAKVFRSVLGILDFLQKYLCMTSKITKVAPSIVKIPRD